MKKIRTIFLATLISIFAFSTFGCAHPEIVAYGFQEFAWLHDGHIKNSWEPRTFKGKGISEKTGRYYNRQVQYASEYPNSFMDIFYVDEDPAKSKNLPLLVFMHGGCFWWGDCTTGNPVVRTDLDRFIENFNSHENPLGKGYNVVIIDYALAPDYIFPTQLIQINQALNYIKNHADELNLSLNNLFLGGNSAGAVGISQYEALVANEEYCKLINFPKPAVTKDQVRAVEIDDGFWDWEWMADPIKICAGNYMNKSVYLGRKQVYKYDIVNHVTENYPATCVVSGVFTHDSYRLYDKIRDKGNDAIIIDGKGERKEKKTHCYLITDCRKGNNNVEADFKKLLEFFDKQLK